MNTMTSMVRPLLFTVVTVAFIAGCAAKQTRPDGADDARYKLTRLQEDSQLASRAPVAINEAERAVIAAERPQSDRVLGKHLVFIADRKVDIASARAQSRLLEDERETLSDQREGARLDARTREADAAHDDAASARGDAAAARSESEDLQRQIAELNARETDRGLVVTLGDLLFATDRSDIKGGAASNLGRLALFLNEYPDRTVMIEGHTDNVGSADYNVGLSQRRADSVKTYLVGRGVASGRLTASGMGKTSPVAGNDSATGRQQNRRVEVIISNTVTSQR